MENIALIVLQISIVFVEHVIFKAPSCLQRHLYWRPAAASDRNFYRIPEVREFNHISRQLCLFLYQKQSFHFLALSLGKPHERWQITRTVKPTDFERLQLRLRLRPGNIDADSSSDSASTPPNKNSSILKIAIWCSNFLDFPFNCTQTGSIGVQHPCAQTAD